MDVRMDGRVAVITGGSTGLGLAMAKEFAASGASVAMLARKADVLATAKAEVQKAAGKTNAKVEGYSCDVSKAAADRRDLEEDRGRLRQGRHRREQRRHQPRQGLRHRDRRGLAGRSRPQAVRRHPPLPARVPRHARAQVGQGRQCAEHRRQGARRQLDADQRQPRRRPRAHQGDEPGERQARRAGERDAGRPDRERPVAAPPQDGGGRGQDLRGVPRRHGRAASRSAAWARPRSSPAWPASSAPMPARSSPAWRSTSTAARARSSDGERPP